MSLLDVHIILTSTLISWLPFILLNFWSVNTRKILDCVSSGISEISSIKSIPLVAFSSAPYEIEPLFFSSPNNSSSYFSKSSKAPFITINGPFFRFDSLCIFLEINYLPEPVGPLIKILLSEIEILFIWFLIFWILSLLPIKSYE